MRATKLIDSILKSPVPNWNSVELSDISAHIQRKKGLYSRLRRVRNQPNAAKEAESIIEDVKKLCVALAQKWASRSRADLNEEISRMEARLGERENSFDSLYLGALKSQRSGLAPVPATKRRSSKPKKALHVTSAEPIANPFATVIQLSAAFSIEFCADHTHFVRAPIRAGVQPCLIELKQLDGKVKLVDALTVLPTSVVSNPVTDPIYAAYLDLIAREYDGDIRRLLDDQKVQKWTSKTPDDPPFRCAALSATRQSVFEALENSPLFGRQPFLKEGVTELVHRATTAEFWHPQHVEVCRTTIKWPEAWAILAGGMIGKSAVWVGGSGSSSMQETLERRSTTSLARKTHYDSSVNRWACAVARCHPLIDCNHRSHGRQEIFSSEIERSFLPRKSPSCKVVGTQSRLWNTSTRGSCLRSLNPAAG